MSVKSFTNQAQNTKPSSQLQKIQNALKRFQKRNLQIGMYEHMKRTIIQFLQKAKGNINHDQTTYQKNKSNIMQAFQFINDRFQKHGLIFVYVLYHQKNVDKINSEGQSMLQKIKKCYQTLKTFKQFQINIQKLLAACNQLENKLFKNVNQSKKQTNSQSNSKQNQSRRQQQFIEVAQNVYKYRKKFTEQARSIRKKQYNQLANRIVQKWPHSIYQQIFLNRLKQMLEQPYRKKGDLQFKHCCAVFICKNKYFKTQETFFHEHKNYHWPIHLANIIRHVKKTIVGFLNGKGGIIYIGMREQQIKIQPQGIGLMNQQVLQLFEWIYQRSLEIYPQFSKIKKRQIQKVYKENYQTLKYLLNEDLLSQSNQQKSELKKKQQFQFIINPYISLQFISLVDTNTYLDAYGTIQQKKQQTNKSSTTNQGYSKRKYLVKIKVKPGTKAETYHLLKSQIHGQIQCFQRKDASVIKLSWDPFMDLLSMRINQFFAQDPQQKIVPGNDCQNCRFRCNIENTQTR